MSWRSFALSLSLRATVIFVEDSSIIQILWSHFARTGQKMTSSEFEQSLSVRALQWRLTGTTSSVFISTAVYIYTLTYV